MPEPFGKGWSIEPTQDYTPGKYFISSTHSLQDQALTFYHFNLQNTRYQLAPLSETLGIYFIQSEVEPISGGARTERQIHARMNLSRTS